MKRNLLVDKLKGYACFLVLFGHVIMGIRLAGINIPQFFEGMEQFIWSFHVALFLFLSGVVYQVTGEWRGKETRLRFILHKFLNLGVPYLTFSIVYIVINSLVGEANTDFSITDIFNIWKTPIAQYWFLYVLFFLFFIWAVCSCIFKNWQITLIAVAVGYFTSAIGFSMGYFDTILYFALAFGIGTFVDFESLVRIPLFAKISVVLLHIVSGIVLISVEMIDAPFVKEFMLLFGIYSSVMLISMLENCKVINRFLVFVNKYSFQIYLLHTIFTAGIRIILVRFNVTQWWIHIVAGTVCGLLFSILVAVISNKVRLLNFFFFPSKALHKRKGN